MNPSDDELASAWLDGELTEAERSQVELDPAVRRARDELGRVRDELGEPVVAPGDVRDRQIAMAVAEAASAQSNTTEGPQVVSLSSRRAVAGSSWWLSRAAAAALVVGGLGAGLVVLAGDDADDDTMATATLESDQAGDAAARSTQAEGEEAAVEEAEALTAEESMGDEAGGTAPAASVSAVASELVASQELDATELFDELVLRFGPIGTWPPSGETLSGCAGELDQQQPDEAPHVAVPFERAGTSLELIVPAVGPPRYVDPESCLVVD